MFDKFSKIAELYSCLYNLKFYITIANLKEIFNMFFIRFTLAIILLNFTDYHKILNF